MTVLNDLTHAASTYGISIQGDVIKVDDHWEFKGVECRYASSTPYLFRADNLDSGGFQIRRIRKRTVGE